MSKAQKNLRMEWIDDIPYPVKETPEWSDINWKKIERRVFKLQKRIYRASSCGDYKTVRKLQKTLMRSWSAKCLATRRVTQDNQGKKTAGVDGVKTLSPVARMNLIGQLKLGNKSRPARRVWIPKPGKNEKRPLGIPTIYDRSLQALVKLALEPEWEAKFEPNSYGFRAGRSCHDAIGAIFNAINKKAKYVLDADIANCFDRINHRKLLEKLNTFPTLARQIRAWLKSGVVDNRQLFPTSEGTPQGGILSPLLANIALHGMENRLKEFAQTLPGKKQANIKALSFIRYADDFVILHEDLTVIQRCKGIISDWLNDIGLELKPEKTKLVHTLNHYEGQNPGFNFLGFNIRQYKVGKHHSGTSTNGKPLGFKTLIKPSKKAIKVHYETLARTIDAHKSAPQSALISKLNPIIRGWAKYFSAVTSKDTYSCLDELVYQKLYRWAKRRHPTKSWKWRAKKYWRTINNNNWVFASNIKQEKPLKLIKHAETPIVRHAKVKGEASIFDGDWLYWSARMGNYPETPKGISKLLKRQNGKCAHCGLFFKDGDLVEIDHIIPKAQGGNNSYSNLQLLHRHCHDIKTAADEVAGGVFDKDYCAEEPDEVKASRPVLKTSREGDFPA